MKQQQVIIKKKNVLSYGDSIEKDVKAALNYGIKAIWYNPNKKETDIDCVQINNFQELKSIL